MKYKRRINHYSSSLNMLTEMWKLGMQTSQMMISSGQVISHRSKMMEQAASGKISWNDPEFALLWQEKLFANIEAYNSVSKSIMTGLLIPKADMAENSAAMIKAINSATRPYHRKAKANAKRLTKRK